MHRFFQRMRRKSQSSCGRLTARPMVECLEARRLLSATFHGGPLLQQVQVETVYDGPAWSSKAALRIMPACGVSKLSVALRMFSFIVIDAAAKASLHSVPSASAH